MIPNWTTHLKDPEDKKRFISYIHNSKGLLDRLNDILTEMETSVEQKESDYDSPGWAAYQADNNGYRRCLRQIRKLITLDQKEK